MQIICRVNSWIFHMHRKTPRIHPTYDSHDIRLKWPFQLKIKNEKNSRNSAYLLRVKTEY